MKRSIVTEEYETFESILNKGSKKIEKSDGTYLTTIDDFERAYGSREFAERAFKADDPLLTTTSAAYATHYGAKIWAQLNFETNLMSILEKVPWGPMDGWRVLSAAPSPKGYSVAENGVIPDSEKPTFASVYDKPKSMVTVFDESELEMLSARRGQAILWQDLRNIMGEFHKQFLNEKLTTSVDDAHVSTDPYSIDRVISSHAEMDNCLTGAGDADVYNLDRDAADTWADSTVIHNSGVPTAITLPMINELIETVSKRSGIFGTDDLVFVTGYDTISEWSELLQPYQKFNEAKFVNTGLGGIKRWAGRDGGFILNTYRTIPIVPNQFLQNSLAVSGTNLTPIFLINKKYLKLWIDAPTVYRETGVNKGQELLYGKLGERGMFKTIGDTVCTFFGAHGKLRDISAS